MSDASTYIEQFAATIRRMIAQTGEVAKQAAPKISDGKYTADAWMKSATQLMDIAALGFIEIAENAVAGPSAPMAPILVTSDPFPVPGTASEEPRTLKFTKRLARAGTIDYVPDTAVTFVSPADPAEADRGSGTLPPNAADFRFTVDTTDLPSGLYTGEVTVGAASGDRVGDPVPVVIAL